MENEVAVGFTSFSLKISQKQYAQIQKLSEEFFFSVSINIDMEKGFKSKQIITDQKDPSKTLYIILTY